MACIAVLAFAAHGSAADALPVPGSVPVNRDLVKARLPIVAVATLESRGVGTNEAGVIADNLAAKLQQSGKFRVMERTQMQQILKEQSFQQSGSCDQGQCAVEMARLLGIDRIVIGSVGLVGSTYSFNLRLVDVATGEALRTSARNRKGTIDDVLTDLVPQAVADLSGIPDRPAADAAVPASSEAGSESKGSLWPWLLGGAVVAGGAAAAVLLLGGKNSTTPAAASTSAGTTDDLKFTW
jgi:hypothetical protein